MIASGYDDAAAAIKPGGAPDHSTRSGAELAVIKAPLLIGLQDHGSLVPLDEAPKANFPPVLFRHRGAIGFMRSNRACSTVMHRERVE
ncbi:MAG: hypothetical protein ACREDJ_08405, partial [Methylocella sp.]